jgi:hypothetical protein
LKVALLKKTFLKLLGAVRFCIILKRVGQE